MDGDLRIMRTELASAMRREGGLVEIKEDSVRQPRVFVSGGLPHHDELRESGKDKHGRGATRRHHSLSRLRGLAPARSRRHDTHRAEVPVPLISTGFYPHIRTGFSSADTIPGSGAT